MNWSLWIGILALVLSVVAIGVLLAMRVELKALEQRLKQTSTKVANAVVSHESRRGPVYVIYNPSKPHDWDGIKRMLARAASDASYPEPVWIETTEEDPGAGQTREALSHDPAVVIAAGGDGTVRVVSGELAGSNVPLGILALGTGNLLARNLELPINSIADMAVIALTGRQKPLDVGWLEFVNEGGEETAFGDDGPGPDRHPFVVMAGIGFDAEIMASTDGDLKDKIGPLAYVKAAIPQLHTERMKATIYPGESSATGDSGVTTSARSVMFMNCGELTNGILMDPNADPSDGWLELNVYDVRGGVFGWLDLVRRVGLNGLGVRSKEVPLPGVAGEISNHRVSECAVEVDAPRSVEADGDVLGATSKIHTWLDAAALTVRVRG